MRVHYAVECLKMVTDEFTANNIPYWLDFGTLLGSYREQGVISTDYDLDIGILDDYADDVKQIIDKGIEEGKWSNPRWLWKDGEIYQLMFPNIFSGEVRGTYETRIFYLDIYFYKARNNRVYALHWNHDGIERYKLPLSNIKNLGRGKFDKYEFNVPYDVPSILRMRYGENYMIPQLKNGNIDWAHSTNNVDDEYCVKYIDGQTVAYTAGTFDMFHIGHLNLLRRMKEKYGTVIAGVHDDNSITHKPKPTICYEQRLDIIQSCKYVDEVYQHAPLITTNQVLDDVKAHLVVAGKEADEYINYMYPVDKDRLVLFDRTENISTRDLKNKIKVT